MCSQYGLIGMGFWACSSKTDEFCHFTVTIRIRFGRVSTASRIKVSLVLVIAWGHDTVCLYTFVSLQYILVFLEQTRQRNTFIRLLGKQSRDQRKLADDE